MLSPFLAVIFLVLWLVKKRVILPRVGIVEFGAWRKKRTIRFNVVMFLVLTVAFVLRFLSKVKIESIPGWMHVAQFSLIFLAGFCIAAYFLNFTRLYVYGVLVALSPLIGELLNVYFKARHYGYPMTFGILAGLIIFTGLVLLVRFLQVHPMPIDQSSAGETSE